VDGLGALFHVLVDDDFFDDARTVGSNPLGRAALLVSNSEAVAGSSSLPIDLLICSKAEKRISIHSTPCMISRR